MKPRITGGLAVRRHHGRGRELQAEVRACPACNVGGPAGESSVQQRGCSVVTAIPLRKHTQSRTASRIMAKCRWRITCNCWRRGAPQPAIFVSVQHEPEYPQRCRARHFSVLAHDQTAVSGERQPKIIQMELTLLAQLNANNSAPGGLVTPKGGRCHAFVPELGLAMPRGFRRQSAPTCLSAAWIDNEIVTFACRR